MLLDLQREKKKEVGIAKTMRMALSLLRKEQPGAPVRSKLPSGVCGALTASSDAANERPM